ncbi:MAG: single-stranded DNA-binding protein [Mycetocola sp.]
MANPLNNGNLIGRVAQDIREFKNADGSKVLLVTIAVDNNFTSGADKTAKTQYIPARAFLPKSVSGRGSWDRVHKGDQIAVQTRISCEPYTKNGETVYPEPTIEIDGFPQFLESKAVTDARAARKAVAAEAPAAPAAEETQEETIARLTAELAAQSAPAVNYDETSPFATV